MISPEYCQTMARYNQWQNKNLRTVVEKMDEKELIRDRGAFFGSIFATMNHVLWADMLWMNRFDGGDAPAVEAKDHVTLTPDLGEWDRLRFITDGRIREWAKGLHAVDLVGNLTWYSGMAKAELTKPLALCIMHFFNHQTHHRGQIHAMLTAAGQTPGVTDLALMPEEP